MTGKSKEEGDMMAKENWKSLGDVPGPSFKVLW
jgi:hypothetical protein